MRRDQKEVEQRMAQVAERLRAQGVAATIGPVVGLDGIRRWTKNSFLQVQVLEGDLDGLEALLDKAEPNPALRRYRVVLIASQEDENGHYPECQITVTAANTTHAGVEARSKLSADTCWEQWKVVSATELTS